MFKLHRLFFVLAFLCFLFLTVSSLADQDSIAGFFSIEKLEENREGISERAKSLELVQLDSKGIRISDLRQLAGIGKGYGLEALPVYLVFEQGKGLQSQSEIVTSLSLENELLSVDYESDMNGKISFPLGKTSGSQLLDLRINGEKAIFRVTQYEIDQSLPLKGVLSVSNVGILGSFVLIQFNQGDLKGEFEGRQRKISEQKIVREAYQRRLERLHLVLQEILSNRGRHIGSEWRLQLIKKFPALKLTFDALVDGLKSIEPYKRNNNGPKSSSELFDTVFFKELEMLYFGLVPESPDFIHSNTSLHAERSQRNISSGYNIEWEKSHQPLTSRLMELMDLYFFLLLEAQNHFHSGANLLGNQNLVWAFRVYLEMYVAIGKNQGDLTRLKSMHGVHSLLGGIAAGVLTFGGMKYLGIDGQVIPGITALLPAAVGVLDGWLALDSADKDYFREEGPETYFWMYPWLVKWGSRRLAKKLINSRVPAFAQYSLSIFNLGLPPDVTPLDLSGNSREPFEHTISLPELVSSLIEVSQKGEDSPVGQPVRTCVSQLAIHMLGSPESK
ncbi:MAG: hypothetical protein KDD35_02490 [Bdellovibrionales bacterium]|nr:hypothetical protein [Bdellovibrionales bacterium]